MSVKSNVGLYRYVTSVSVSRFITRSMRLWGHTEHNVFPSCWTWYNILVLYVHFPDVSAVQF